MYVRVAVKICATLVNILTHRHTDRQLLTGYTIQPELNTIDLWPHLLELFENVGTDTDTVFETRCTLYTRQPHTCIRY